MKQPWNAAFARLDTFCSRLNDGLTAVAILLGFLVMTMSVIRAQEFMPDILTSMPADYSPALGE